MWYTIRCYAKANVSAKKTETTTRPWIPTTDEDPDREERPRSPETKRAEAIDGLLKASSMVSRKHRIVKDADFRRIFSLGRRTRWMYGELFLLRNRVSYPRVAVVVSTRVSKKATIRNRLRRQTYEWVRHWFPHITGGWDCVIRLSPKSVSASSRTFLSSLEMIFKKQNLSP